jgi:DNA-binding transcriptional LysR family regulator
MEPDFNDMYFFTQTVEHGGFAPAGRALGVPKSRLSRRIALLEERLGVRLLQRSSRSFVLTDIGQIYLRHCQAMIAEAQAGQDAIDRVRAEPRGQVRVSCPLTVAQEIMAPILSEFMNAYPEVSIMLDVTNRRVDVIEEGYDLALRVRPTIDDSELVARVFGTSRVSLLCSPALFNRFGEPGHPRDLAALPSLSMTARDNKYAWTLIGPQGEDARVDLTPRLLTDDMITLRAAAIGGIGVVALPEYMCREAMLSGQLVRALPQWMFPAGYFHAVYPSRRGLVPAVRTFIDFLVQRIPQMADEFQMSRTVEAGDRS